MNYMYLMKKISQEVEIENEDTLKLNKIVKSSDIDFESEKYKEEIKRFSEGNLKDLYC